MTSFEEIFYNSMVMGQIKIELKLEIPNIEIVRCSWTSTVQYDWLRMTEKKF